MLLELLCKIDVDCVRISYALARRPGISLSWVCNSQTTQLKEMCDLWDRMNNSSDTMRQRIIFHCYHPIIIICWNFRCRLCLSELFALTLSLSRRLGLRYHATKSNAFNDSFIKTGTFGCWVIHRLRDWFIFSTIVPLVMLSFPSTSVWSGTIRIYISAHSIESIFMVHFE